MTHIERYSSIQIARALAAIAVLLVHSRTVPNYIAGAHYSHGLWTFGQAGVDVFFMISGFIIAAVVQRPQPVSQFVARRWLRILPFYWFFTLCSTAVLIIGYQDPPSLTALAMSFGVLPQNVMPVLGVGWSLEHEFIFYAIVALLLACGRIDQLFNVMAGLATASIALNLTMPATTNGVLPLHLLSLYHVQFFAGVALFRWRLEIAGLPWGKLLLLGSLFFPVAAAVLHVAYGTVIPAQPHGALGVARVVLWGIAGASILSGLLACEAQRPDILQSRPARAMIVIGGASYALYLSHPTILTIVGFCLKPIWPAVWSPEIAEVIAITVALGFALAFFRWIEAPLISLLSGVADIVSDLNGRYWRANPSR